MNDVKSAIILSNHGNRTDIGNGDNQDFRCRWCRMMWFEFVRKNAPCPKSLYQGSHNFDFSKPIYGKVSRVNSANDTSKNK